MTPRWMILRIFANNEREALQTVIVYAEHENKEIVKQENRNRTHKRELIMTD